MSKASFRSRRPEVLPQEGIQERSSNPTGEHPYGSVIPCMLKSNLHTDAPLQEHLFRTTSVFSYLKLIIRIIQQILNFARVLHKFYMDSF